MFFKINCNNRIGKLYLKEDELNCDILKNKVSNLFNINVNDIVLNFKNEDKTFILDDDILINQITIIKLNNGNLLELFLDNKNCNISDDAKINTESNLKNNVFVSNVKIENEELNNNSIQKISNMPFINKNNIKEDNSSKYFSVPNNLKNQENFNNNNKSFFPIINNYFKNPNSLNKQEDKNNISIFPKINNSQNSKLLNNNNSNSNKKFEKNSQSIENSKNIKLILKNEIKEELQKEFKKNINNKFEEIHNSILKINQSQNIINNSSLFNDSNILNNNIFKNDTIHDINCNNCYNKIIGNRYKCLYCSDIDLCESCENIINHQHNFIKIKSNKLYNYEELSIYYINYIIKDNISPINQINNLNWDISKYKSTINKLKKNMKIQNKKFNI